MDLFERTVSAICYSIARDLEQGGTASEEWRKPPYNDVVRFALSQHARMSAALRTPLVAGTLGFSFASIRHGGALFHQLSCEARARRLAAWRDHRIPPCRDLVRFYESLVTLAFYSRKKK